MSGKIYSTLKYKDIAIIILIILSFHNDYIFNFCGNSHSVDIFNLEASSEGQYVDHIYLFQPPETDFQFNLYFEKNHRYNFYFKLMMPDVYLDLWCQIIGPDADGDGELDSFIIADGKLSNIESITDIDSCNVQFGAALSGNYTLTIQANCEENVNIHIVFSDKGVAIDDDFMISDLNAYTLTQSRQYCQVLEEDMEYRVSVQRASALVADNEVYATIKIFDEDNNEFVIINRVPLLNSFLKYSQKFATSSSGIYQILISIDTNVETVNLIFGIEKVDEVGDGPEEQGPDDPEIIEPSDSIIRNLSVPSLKYLIVGSIGIVIIIVIFLVTFKLKY